MECENKFCLYQSDGKCIIDDVRIDSSGKCNEMIYIDIDDETLERAKNELLERYANG